MIFENTVLFTRDALISREFNDAIKASDSGRTLGYYPMIPIRPYSRELSVSC